MPERNDPESADPHKIAMPKGGNPEADAAGAMKGGEAQRGAQDAAPRDLGRKDPTTTGESAPHKDNVPIRD
jgi:hypothetical protein